MDVQQASYYTGNMPFLNMWYPAGAVIIFSSIGGNNGKQGLAAWQALGTNSLPYFNNSTGELNNPVQSDLTSIERLIFSPPSFVGSSGYPGVPWWQGQVLKISWNGTATGSIGPGTTLGTGGTSSFGANSGTITLGSSGVGNVYFQLTITNINDPPHGVKVWLSPQYDANVAAGQYLNPDWVGIIGKFGIIRWMGWAGTNNSQLSDYAQLSDFNYTSIGYAIGSGLTAAPAGTLSGNGPKASFHPSVLTYVANWTKSHPYFNIPYCANSTFCPQVAAYFNTNLNPGLIPRFEFGNEPWNPGNELTFAKCNIYPWPPLGGSAPFQQAVTISSITPSTSPTTVTTSTNHGYSSGNFINFALVGGTMPATLDNVGYVITVTGLNTFTIAVNTTGLTFSSGTVYVAGNPYVSYGYLASTYMQQVRDAYGPSNRSKWKGEFGVQTVVATGNMFNALSIGLAFYLANSAINGVTTAADLFDEVVVAPYFGNNILNGSAISALTVSATPTVTLAANPGFTIANGQIIRFYALTGMTQINNMTATVSGVSANTFNINIDTSTFSAWAAANGNFCMLNDIPALIDASVTNNANSPATYPTKYSYFTQEMCDSIINGTSTNAGYVTGSIFGFTSGGLPLALINIALLANSYGLGVSCYEGGNTFCYYDTNGQLNISDQPTVLDFINNWKYDNGTTSYNMQSVYSACWAALKGKFTAAGGQIGYGVNSAYGAQNVDGGGGNGAFEGMRFYPGDQGNANFAPIVVQNALGPWVDPTEPASWTISPAYNTSTNYFHSSSNAETDTFSPNLGAGACVVLVGVAIAGGSITSVVVGGVTLTLDVTESNGPTEAIYRGSLTSGQVATGGCTVNYSGAAFNARNIFVATVTGLASASPVATGVSTGPTKAVNYIKGGLIFAVGEVLNGTSSFSATSGVGPGVSTVLYQDLEDANKGCMALITAPFSSSIFSVSKATSGGIAVAVYR